MSEESIAEIIPHPAVPESQGIHQTETIGQDTFLSETITNASRSQQETSPSVEIEPNIVQVELDPRVPDMTYRVDGQGEVSVQLPYTVTVSETTIHFNGLDYKGDSELYDIVWYGNRGVCYFQGKSENFMPDYLGQENSAGYHKYERVIELYKDDHGNISARSEDLNPRIAKRIVDASFSDKKDSVRDVSAGADFVSTAPERRAAA